MHIRTYFNYCLIIARLCFNQVW